MARRRWLRRTIGMGVLAGAAYAVWRAIEANRTANDAGWEPQPFPFPPQPRQRTTPVGDSPSVSNPSAPESGTSWLAPVDGRCPASHPVKAKLVSGIFHVPGGQSYDRTVPDRCYTDAATAEADGLRPSKR
jgi:hypothetical protein